MRCLFAVGDGLILIQIPVWKKNKRKELLKERQNQSPSPFRHNLGCCPSSRNAAELPSPLRRGFPKKQDIPRCCSPGEEGMLVNRHPWSSTCPACVAQGADSPSLHGGCTDRDHTWQPLSLGVRQHLALRWTLSLGALPGARLFLLLVPTSSRVPWG